MLTVFDFCFFSVFKYCLLNCRCRWWEFCSPPMQVSPSLKTQRSPLLRSSKRRFILLWLEAYLLHTIFLLYDCYSQLSKMALSGYCFILFYFSEPLVCFVFFVVVCLLHFASIHHKFIPKFSTDCVHPLVVHFNTLVTRMLDPSLLWRLFPPPAPTWAGHSSSPKPPGTSIYHHPTGLPLSFTCTGPPAFQDPVFFFLFSSASLFYRIHLLVTPWESGSVDTGDKMCQTFHI